MMTGQVISMPQETALITSHSICNGIIFEMKYQLITLLFISCKASEQNYITR
jgi:hypothetical protein